MDISEYQHKKLNKAINTMVFPGIILSVLTFGAFGAKFINRQAYKINQALLDMVDSGLMSKAFRWKNGYYWIIGDYVLILWVKSSLVSLHHLNGDRFWAVSGNLSEKQKTVFGKPISDNKLRRALWHIVWEVNSDGEDYTF